MYQGTFLLVAVSRRGLFVGQNLFQMKEADSGELVNVEVLGILLQFLYQVISWFRMCTHFRSYFNAIRCKHREYLGC